MKKSIVIFLIACLIFPLSGTYFFILLKENNIRNEVNAIILNNLEDKDLIILTFSEEEIRTKLTWKHSHEFQFDGHMYDIVEQGREGDSIWYKCYRDHKETRLNLEKKKLMARAQGQDPFQKKQNERIKNFFNSLFLQHYITSINCISSTSSIHYSLKIKNYSLIFISPPSPPPKSS